MEAILHTFGIDWKLLLIQGINFAILLGGLTYFLYKPVLRMIDERREKMATGVKEAEQARKELEEIEKTRKEKLAQAGEEADQVVANARMNAQEKGREIVSHAETGAAAILKEAEAQASETKSRAISESKEEVAKLIVLGMEKALVKK
jgi:F-type H+-transporting ATPase subunit b